jgi:hypothetical protein
VSAPGDYENFDLLVERDGEGFRVSVLSSPAGEGEAELKPPYSEEGLQKILTRLADTRRDVRSAASPRETVKKLGTKLFEGLFRDQVGNLWVSSRERVKAANQGLRLRLRFREDAAIFESWPWELLFDPSRGRFLAQSNRTPVVRYLNLFNPTESLQAEPPLRMLVAIAQPSGYPGLDADREWERVRHALRPWIDQGWLRLERLERATLEELRRNLADPCHILHIVGHGHLDRKQSQGALVLEDETGRARIVQGDTLGAILAAQRELRLVVLNACEGARTLKDDPFAGVAQALVECRIPAVIAMRSRISDLAAVTFAEHFYDAIGRNMPVDVALAEARHGMLSRGDDLEWATPVLYTRSSDLRLFRFPPPGSRPVSPGKPAWDLLGRVPWPAWVIAATLSMTGVFYSFVKAVPVDPNLAYEASNPPECPSPPGLSIAFVKVPAGSVLSPEKPHHEVTIANPFCISRFEVTQAQWKKIMGDNPSGHKGDALPVEGVLWEEIEEFLKRLNARSPGANHRLPTNAQWEYAARAGTAGTVSFDGNLEDLSRYGNCKGTGSTIQVGSLAANPWGIFDMYGTVAELVRDDPLSATATPGMNALAGVLPEKHVRRGGSFRTKPENCDSLNPSAVQSRRNKDTGFRIIRDLQR